MTLDMASRFLRDHRNRIVSAARVGGELAASLSSLAQLLDALGRFFSDDRWHQLATALDQAAVRCREVALARVGSADDRNAHGRRRRA